MHCIAAICVKITIRQWTCLQEPHGPWCSAWETTWPCAKVAHILHFYLRGRNWAYFHSMSSNFRNTCQLSNNWAWNLVIDQSARSRTYILSFYPRGSKLSLCSLYGQWFLRYRTIFEIAIFGHETWPLVKSAKRDPNFRPFRSTVSRFQENWDFWILHWLQWKNLISNF